MAKIEVKSESKIPERSCTRTFMLYYRKGYQQALKDINTEKKVIKESWSPSRCPQCKEDFSDFEPCNDGYYTRCTSMLRCPFCGQKLKWD